MERDQEAERRQEAEQKVPHGLPRAPTVTSGSACLSGRHGTGRGPLGLQTGGSVLKQQHHWAFCGTALCPHPLQSRPAPAAQQRASRQLLACCVVGQHSPVREGPG